MNFLINKAKASEIGDSLDNAISTTATPVNDANNLSSESTASEGGIMSFLPLIIMFAVFYFFLIRPQSKKQKHQQDMISNLKAGDKIVTNSGIVGIIRKISKEEKIVTIEIAENVQIKLFKNFIQELYDNQTIEKKDTKTENKVEKTVEKTS